MRILILSPTALPFLTGNAVTVERWRRFLERHQGVSVSVFSAQRLTPEAFIEKLLQVKPDILHVHHAYRAGNLLLDHQVSRACSSIPFVVSPGGTDINLDFNVEEKRELIVRVYQKASRIIAQSRGMVSRLHELFPSLRERIHWIPKAFYWFGDEPFDLRKAAGCSNGDILFFLPAGIRPVKGNLECLKAFQQLHSLRPKARIVFAGPALDHDYAVRFEDEVLRSRPYASWIHGVPLQAMRSAYEASDVVLNTSFSEGLSNALLEALAAGKPVLASNISGNRGLVLGEKEQEPAGLLFEPDRLDDFLKQALTLIDNESLRRDCGRLARRWTSGWPTPEIEARALIEIYQMVLKEEPPHGKR